MNPLLLSGGKFLLFYLVVAGGVIVLVARLAYGRAGPSPRLSELTADPYGIAALREGAAECVRLAVFNLLDRGLLEWRDDGCLAATRMDAAQLVRRPLDQTVLRACVRPSTPSEVLAHPTVAREAKAYEKALAERGLLRDAADRTRRVLVAFGACAFLAILAATKVALATAAGRTNVGILVMLAAFACIGVCLVSRRRLTVTGERVFADLKSLVNRLRLRAESLRGGGATNEALLLASVFGLWALPAQAFPIVEQVFPRPRPDSGSSDGGGSDSSCSSNDGGDGGGGGGGCGGCGSD